MKQRAQAFPWYTGVFVGAAGLLLLAYAWLGVYPFGDLSVMHADMNSQYVDFHAFLQRVLRGEDSFLYSFSMGLGGSALPLFAYYLMSPFSLLVMFFDTASLPDAMLWITLLKVGSMAASYLFFARKTLRQSGPLAAACALCYALGSYVVNYASNIMWLDAWILLPVILVYAHRLLTRGQWRGLFVSLLLLFIVQFYIGYIVGIFVLLCFLTTGFALRPPHFGRRLGQFVGVAVLAAGCCAALLIPTALRLFGNAGDTLFSEPMSWAFTHVPADMLKRAFFGVFDSIRDGGLPALFCGSLCLLLLPAYLFNPGISRRERVAFLGLLLAMGLSLFLPPLIFFWHAFKHIIWYQTRFSLAFSFLMIFAAQRCLAHLDTVRRWVPVAWAGVLCLLILIVSPVNFSFSRPGISWVAALCVLGFLGIVLALLWLPRARRALSWALVLLVAGELWGNAALQLAGMHQEGAFADRDAYATFIEERGALIAELPEGAPYRVESNSYRTGNDNLSLGVMGVQHFNSTDDRNLGNRLHQMGFSCIGVIHLNVGGTIATDSLLGIRYLLGEDARNDYYYGVAEQEDITAFENPYAFPLAFMASDRANEVTLPEFQFVNLYGYSYRLPVNPFEIQNQQFQALLGDENARMYLPFEFTASPGVRTETPAAGQTLYTWIGGQDEVPARAYNLTAVLDAPVYGYWHGHFDSARANVTLEGRTVVPIEPNVNSDIVLVGQFWPGETVDLAIELEKGSVLLDMEAVYTLNMPLLEEASDRFYDSQMEIDTWKGGEVSGRVVAEEGQALFLSIPYDGGWRAWVDGVSTAVEPALGVFLTVPVEPGEHTIRLDYWPVGLTAGLTVSLISLLALCGLLGFSWRKKRRTA